MKVIIYFYCFDKLIFFKPDNTIPLSFAKKKSIINDIKIIIICCFDPYIGVKLLMNFSIS